MFLNFLKIAIAGSELCRMKYKKRNRMRPAEQRGENYMMVPVTAACLKRTTW
jgi:hypothetical protein